MTIRHLASNVLELLAPLDETAVPPAPITSFTSCTGRLYDAMGSFIEAPTTAIVEELDAGEVGLDVGNALGFQSTATVELTMVSGKVHRTTISSIAFGATASDPDTITLAVGPTEKVAAQEPIRQVSYLTAATILFVRHPERFAVGETVAFRDAAGTRQTKAITEIGRSHLVVGATASAIAVGEAISRKLGADITLAGFNLSAAAAATDDWGYRGTIAATHADLRPGMLVAAEIELVTASLTAIELVQAPVLSR